MNISKLTLYFISVFDSNMSFVVSFESLLVIMAGVLVWMEAAGIQADIVRIRSTV